MINDDEVNDVRMMKTSDAQKSGEKPRPFDSLVEYRGDLPQRKMTREVRRWMMDGQSVPIPTSTSLIAMDANAG